MWHSAVWVNHLSIKVFSDEVKRRLCQNLCASCFASNLRSANLLALILWTHTRRERERFTAGAHDRLFSRRCSFPLSVLSLTHTHAQSSANESTWAVYICNNVQCVCVLLRRPRRFIVIVCFAGLSPLAPSSLNVWALFSTHSSALERHKCFIYIQFLELTFKLWKIPGEVFRNAAHKKKLFKFKVFCSMFCSLN